MKPYGLCSFLFNYVLVSQIRKCQTWVLSESLGYQRVPSDAARLGSSSETPQSLFRDAHCWSQRCWGPWTFPILRWWLRQCTHSILPKPLHFSTSVFLLPLWCFFFYSTSRHGSAPGIHHQPSSLFSSQKQLIQGIPLNTACKKGLSDLSLLPESELCTPNIPTHPTASLTPAVIWHLV